MLIIYAMLAQRAILSANEGLELFPNPSSQTPLRQAKQRGWLYELFTEQIILWLGGYVTLQWIHFYDMVLAIVLEHSATEMKPCYGKEFRKAGNTRAMNTEKSLKLSRH